MIHAIGSEILTLLLAGAVALIFGAIVIFTRRKE